MSRQVYALIYREGNHLWKRNDYSSSKKKGKKKHSNDWIFYIHRVCLTETRVGGRDAFLGLWGTLAPSSIKKKKKKKSIKSCILQLHWYKEKCNLGWVHCYVFTTIIFIFLLFLKELKWKHFRGPLKACWTPGTVHNGWVNSGSQMLHF